MTQLDKCIAVAVLLALVAGCGPSPEAVCDHVIDLTRRELGEEAANGIDRADCVKSAEREKEMKGMLEYSKQAKCITSTNSFEALGACEQ